MVSRSAELSPHKATESQGLSLLADFAWSCVYSGLQGPACGAAQLVDRIGGTHTSSLITFIKPPQLAEFGTLRWHIQTAGAALGTMLDFAFINRLTRGNEQRLLECNGVSGSVREAGFFGSSTRRAFAMGGAFEGICKEVPENENFIVARLKNAAVGGTTFAAMTGSFGILKQLGLSNKLIAGVTSGIPAGFVSAEGQSLAHQGKYASGKEILQSIYGFSLIGGAFSFGGKSQANNFQGNAMFQSAVEAKFTMDTRSESGPFKNRADFDQRGVQQVERLVNIYQLRSPWTHKVIIAKDFDQSLNELRALNETVQHHPHRYQLLPEQVPEIVATLPNATYFNKIIIADERNPTDIFYSQKAGREVYSAAKTTPGNDTITIFPGRNGARPEQQFKHEWSHQLEVNTPQWRESFEIVAKMEREGHFDRHYAKLNNSENWAVHMEALLDNDVQQFANFVDKAPLRAVILGRALKVSLDACPPEQRSSLHDRYLERADYIKQREPQVVSKLIETFRNSSLELQADVAKLLAVVGDAPIETLTSLIGESSKYQAPAIQALLELGPKGIESGRLLFEQGTLNNPSAVAELVASLNGESAQVVFKQALNRLSIGDRQQLALEVLRLSPLMHPYALGSLQADCPANFQQENWPSSAGLENETTRSFYNDYLGYSACRDQLPKWEDDWAKFFSSLLDGNFDDNYSDGLR